METNENRHRHQEIELLSDLILYYDRSQSEYNRNMTDIISLVRVLLERNTRESRRNNTERRTRNLFQQTTSPLFSYTNYPLSNSNGLTNYQIEHSTQILPYESSMRDTVCPISFEEFTVGESIMKVRFCGHIFKIDSIRNWFQRNTRCPVCRYDLTTYRRPLIREINLDISSNQIIEQSLPENAHPARERQSMSDIENNIVDNINRIFQNITFPAENREESDSMLSRYVFEFPIYYDVSTNRIE